jgi:peptide/nickel transport system permease protein
VLRYALLRVLQAVPVLIGITVIGFVLIHLVPGDAAQATLGTQATPESLARLRAQYGLDEPVVQQYRDFVSGAIRLDFGTSLRLREPVGSLIGDRAVPSALLIAYSLAFALLLAIPLAVYSAMRKDRAADQGIRLFGMATFAMPDFWLALLLVLVFSLQLGWFPSSGYGEGAIDVLRTLTLPAATIGLGLAPLLLRTLRSSLIETLDAGYVEAARARGYGEPRIFVRLVLRNSLLPMITILGLIVGFLVSYTVVVETIFGIPGLGSLLVSSVSDRDFPVIQGLVVVAGVVVVAINLLTDLLYAVLDPRVRL